MIVTISRPSYGIEMKNTAVTIDKALKVLINGVTYLPIKTTSVRSARYLRKINTVKGIKRSFEMRLKLQSPESIGNIKP